MSTGAYLVLTHGTSDLQILLRDKNGRLWRAMPDKGIVRQFHQWLLDAAPDAEIIPVPPELRDRQAEASITDWNGDSYALWIGNEALDAHPERTPHGRLQLMLPKIQPALDQWLAKQDATSQQAEYTASPLALALKKTGIVSPLVGVLVLSTDRGTDEQEPVATFTFLKRWLLQLGVPEQAIHEKVILHPGEKLESADSPIAPAVAERIERAVREFYDRASKRALLIASMGGLPPIKTLLAEMALLLAKDRAQSLFKTEHGALGLQKNTPIDALRTRRQCLQLVQRGALLEAWAMASPFHDDPDARSWTRPLEQAARLLNGNPVGECVQLPALQRILDHARSAACLLVAIRVETALQGERWLDAINGSMTFLEAAFHDHINAWAQNVLEEYEPRYRHMRFRADPPGILLEKGALEKLADSRTYRAHMVGESALSAWDEVLNSEPLRSLRAVFYDRDNALHRYRNFNTHGVMPQEEIDKALKRFMGADLWSQGTDNPANRPKPGRFFLGRARVRDVITELMGSSEDTPEQLYQNLLQQIEACLIDPTCQP